MSAGIAAGFLPLQLGVIIPKSSIPRTRVPQEDPVSVAGARSGGERVPPAALFQRTMFLAPPPSVNPFRQAPPPLRAAELKRSRRSLLETDRSGLFERDERIGILRSPFSGLRTEDRLFRDPANKALTLVKEEINFLA